MQRCHHCGALVPLEVLLCSGCDGYLGRSVARLGGGVVQRPAAEPVPDVWAEWHDAAAPAAAERKVDWGVVRRKPGGTVVQVGYEVHWWPGKGTRSSDTATVRALGEEWRLASGDRYWSLQRYAVVARIEGLYPVKQGTTHGDRVAGRAAAEQALKAHLRKLLEQRDR